MYSEEPSKSKLRAKKGLTQFIVFPLDRFPPPHGLPFRPDETILRLPIQHFLSQAEHSNIAHFP